MLSINSGAIALQNSKGEKTMKKRRIAIIAFVLVAALTLSVGYAYVFRDLKIEGKAKSTIDNLNVVFSDAKIDPDATTDECESSSSAGTAGDYVISMTASGLKKIGDKVVAVYTIKNYNEYDVTLAQPAITKTGDEAYFNVETDWGTGTKTLAATGETGDNITVTVTVSLADSSADGVACDFIITIKAEAGTPTNPGTGA